MSYVVAILVLIVGIVYTKNTIGPAHKGVYKGYGSNTDDVATLLSRIKWVNHSRGRINYKARYIIYAFILTILIGVIVYNTIPPGDKFIQMLFVTWIVLVASHNFYEHHSEKFVHYCIDSNTKRIMKKLKVRKVKKLDDSAKEHSSLGFAWNFKYDV